MGTDEPEDQDPALPPGWFAWSTNHAKGNDWHARPPGTPVPARYVHAASKAEVADMAWQAHKRNA